MLDTLNISRFNVWRQIYWSETPRLIAPDYCIIARLKLVDKNFWIDGVVLQLAGEYAIFRETSLYILRRRREDAVIEVEDTEYQAQITMTGSYGYRLDFVTPLKDAFVTELRERWRIGS